MNHLELHAKHIVEHGTLSLGRAANTNQRWGLIFEFWVGYVHVNLALYMFCAFSLVKAACLLIVCDKHNWVVWVLDVLGHQLFFDARTAFIDEVKGHL